MRQGASRLGDEVRPFRPRQSGIAAAGWLEVTVYSLAVVGLTNVLLTALG